MYERLGGSKQIHTQSRVLAATVSFYFALNLHCVLQSVEEQNSVCCIGSDCVVTSSFIAKSHYSRLATRRICAAELRSLKCQSPICRDGFRIDLRTLTTQFCSPGGIVGTRKLRRYWSSRLVAPIPYLAENVHGREWRPDSRFARRR
jgi:hypothetical protein